ncbi:hypothetical protein [Actinoplanes sp. NPDC051494]|uniref:hypothetical protein n=1 Tax=Actinoplanes sp. NPDC051494 TaxID=3363907 RepID=UPI0037BA343B
MGADARLQWSAYSYADNSPVSSSDPTGLLTDCGNGGAYMSCGPPTSGGGGDSGSGGSGDSGGGGNSGGGNSGAGSSSGNVVQLVPVVEQKNKCGNLDWVCDGWQRSMEWINQNQDTLGEIAIDLAEMEAGGMAIGFGVPLIMGGFGVEVVSVGTLSVIGVPAAALGVIGVGGGALALGHGTNNLMKDIDNLHWNNQTTGSGSSGRPNFGKISDKDSKHIDEGHSEQSASRPGDKTVWGGTRADRDARIRETLEQDPDGTPNTNGRSGTIHRGEFDSPVGRTGDTRGKYPVYDTEVILNPDGSVRTAYPKGDDIPSAQD